MLILRYEILCLVLYLTETVDLEKYSYSVRSIGFKVHGTFLLSGCSEFSKNVIIIGTDMSSFVHINNKIIK